MKTVKGITLAEVLLAVAILAFALTGLLMIFINCIFLNDANRNLTIACTHAQFAMEEIKNTDFASIASQTWDNATIISKGLVPLDSESIIITVTETEPLDVLVTLNWKDRGVRDRRTALETLITEP